MPLNVETFLALPDLAKQIKTLWKADLIALAEHFEIDVTNKIKADIKSLIFKQLVDEGLVEPVAEKNEKDSDKEDSTLANFKMQLEMKKLELEFENKEKERQQKMEIEKQKMEMEREQREIER